MFGRRNKKADARAPALNPVEKLYIASMYGAEVTLDSSEAAVLISFIESTLVRAQDSESMLDTLVARSPAHQSHAVH